jgi:hypothetical protein
MALIRRDYSTAMDKSCARLFRTDARLARMENVGGAERQW